MPYATLNKSPMSKTIAWVALIGVFKTGLALGNVRLPTLLGDNMVLQRDTTLTLWGWADPGEHVSIEFHGEKLETKADTTGEWSVPAGPFGAGGPYDLAVSGKNRLELHNVLIGDVWLASGQSNMEFPLKWERHFVGVDNEDPDLSTEFFPQIRLFNVQHALAVKPTENVRAVWTAVTPQSVGSFSAVAYLFGRELHQRYRIPIGLIESSWTGTPAEAWMSAGALRRFPAFRPQMDALERLSGKTQADYDRYMRQKAAWYLQHGAEDRGRIDGVDVWADPQFDASGWPTIAEPTPRRACGDDFKGFSGIVWLRRDVIVPPDQGGKDLVLHLGMLNGDDVTYFNGIKVGATRGYVLRDYPVSGRHVLPGHNTLVVRVVGQTSAETLCTGKFFADRMTVAVGGTTRSLAGTWLHQSGPDLHEFPVLDAATLSTIPVEQSPTVLFNGMVNPLIRFVIKGVIWYQGEDNAFDNRSAQYRTLFQALIRDWRAHWGYDFPFLFVQLPGYDHNDAEPADYSWAELREAQSMALSLNFTGMATAVDLGDEENPHPPNKKDVAHRLVLAARRVAYGEPVVDSGPVFKSMQVEGNQVRLKFSDLGSGLQVRDKYDDIRGFEIAASDGKFRWAEARKDGQDIVVFDDAVSQPVAVRYDWMNTPDGTLFNADGLPAAPFRTDAPALPVGAQ